MFGRKARALREARAEERRWRELFALMVIREVGLSTSDRPRVVDISWQEAQHMREGVDVLSWPIVDARASFSVYPHGKAPDIAGGQVYPGTVTR